MTEKEVRLRLPQPHGMKQMALMRALSTPGLREFWSPCGSKFGKSIALSSGMSAACWQFKNGLFRWVAPIYSQAAIGYKYAKRMLPGEPFVTAQNNGLKLLFNENDTVLECKSGVFPEDLEGEAVNGYALDEASKMKAQVYASAKTTTSITRGPIVAISTPRGKNWFYQKSMEAKAQMEWALKKGIPPTHIYMAAPSTDNPFYTQDMHDEMKRSLPERLYRQYVLAEFVDDGEVFTGVDACALGPSMPILADQGGIQVWFDEEAETSRVVIGVDWAKSVDYTVFIAIDIEHRVVVGFMRFQKMTYPDAIRRLVFFGDHFQDVEMIYHDKTGIGSVIDDILAYTDLAYQGVVFSNSSKSEMVTRLGTGIAEKDLHYPNIPEIVDELKKYEVSFTKSGLTTYGNAPGAGEHDDCVAALMLAYSGLCLSSGDMQTRLLESLDPRVPQGTGDAIADYYSSLAEDDE